MSAVIGEKVSYKLDRSQGSTTTHVKIKTLDFDAGKSVKEGVGMYALMITDHLKTKWFLFSAAAVQKWNLKRNGVKQSSKQPCESGNVQNTSS